MRVAVVVVLLAAVTGSVAVATPTPTSDGPTETDVADRPHLVAVYPNPYYEQDRGEFVVVARPPGDAGGNLTLSDGETVVELPAGGSGRLAVATDPAARNLTEAPVVVVPGPFRLANAGEWVALRDGPRELDNVTYPRAPEGALYRRSAGGWAWTRIGATAFPVRTARSAEARLFVLPDAPEAALAPLHEAEDRLWLAAYELTSVRVVEAACAARRRGVDVRVLVELEPVGGMARSQAVRLDRLAGCGVAVRVVGGPVGRYTFHHAKYAVADDRAVVLTENWKPSGVGGRSSRGWGVVVRDPAVTGALAETFEADASWRDARAWAVVRSGRAFERTERPANGSYPSVFTPVAVGPVDVEVVVAPDNAESRVISLLDGADRTIRVIQMSTGGPDQPFVRALLRAARRGVSVQLLLANAWYVREDNRAVASTLAARARDEDLPFQVRLASPRGRYGKIHAKGVVVDGDRVLVGSLNWNNVSARENREVLLLIHGEAAGRYFARVFDADWQGGRWRVPAGLLAVAAALAVAAGAFAARRLEFDAAADGDVVPAADDGNRGLY